MNFEPLKLTGRITPVGGEDLGNLFTKEAERNENVGNIGMAIVLHNLAADAFEIGASCCLGHGRMERMTTWGRQARLRAKALETEG